MGTMGCVFDHMCSHVGVQRYILIVFTVAMPSKIATILALYIRVT